MMSKKEQLSDKERAWQAYLELPYRSKSEYKAFCAGAAWQAASFKTELLNRHLFALAAPILTARPPDEVERWMPIASEDDLPREGRYLVTIVNRNGERKVTLLNWNNIWAGQKAVAWMPLPVPYRPSGT